MTETIEGELAALRAELQSQITELKTISDGYAVVFAEMSEHLAILRTIILYMLLQATADEVDQTEEGNPWKKMLKDYKALLNPHIRKLNALLGIKAEDAAPPKPIVVATS